MVSDKLFKTMMRQTSLPLGRKSLIALAALLLLAACSAATTLGGAAPDRVVIIGTPTWTNGIGQLMISKCAVCHQVPRLPSSPQNVAADLDLRYEKTSGGIRAGEDIAAQIKLGILSHTIAYDKLAPVTVTIPAMPLPFGTPLYPEEIAALQTWATTVVTAEAANTSTALTAVEGEILYKRHCQSCHGVNGAGGLVQRPLRGYGANAGVTFAIKILSATEPNSMYGWPALETFANRCTLTGAPTTCGGGTQLDAIAAYLAQF